MTLAQFSRINTELKRLNGSLPYEGGDDLWVAELNQRCHLNLSSIDELTKREASNVISQLITL